MTPLPPLVDTIFANQVSWLRNINAECEPQPAGHDGGLPARVAFAAAHVVTVASGNDGISDAISTLRRHDRSSILAWAARPDSTADLCLHARGFRESFTPTWMWHDLRAIPPIPVLNAQIVFAPATTADHAAYLSASGVPYIDPETSGGIFDRIIRDHPHTAMLLAWSGDAVMGTGALHLSASTDGPVGGVYNIAVAPIWRRRGIATAITIRLLHLARERGAIGACLNATPDGWHVYQRVGFRDAGHGQTWFLPAGLLLPSADSIAAAEALARGDVAGLDREIAQLETMPNGESPVRFAARFGQDAAIRWLLDHGAHPDIRPLWTKGFRPEAMRAIADPQFRDRLWGTPGATALHEAVRDADEALVRALLDARADRAVVDGEWNSTAVEWARVLGRNRLAAILETSSLPAGGPATD